MKPLDNLCHPVSVIKEAEELAGLVEVVLAHEEVGEALYLFGFEEVGIEELADGERVDVEDVVGCYGVFYLIAAGAEGEEAEEVGYVVAVGGEWAGA